MRSARSRIWPNSPNARRPAAIFEIRETYEPVVFLAAVVCARHFGLALAHALKIAIENPASHRDWSEWANYGTPEERHAFNSFGNAWLRDVVIDKHPCKHWYCDGVDHANRDRYHWRDDR